MAAVGMAACGCDARTPTGVVSDGGLGAEPASTPARREERQRGSGPVCELAVASRSAGDLATALLMVIEHRLASLPRPVSGTLR